MASCEAQLLKQKIISGPLTAKEIAEGALQDHLTQKDYDTPLKVNFLSLQVTCNLPVNKVQLPHFSLATSDSLVVTTHSFFISFREKLNWWPRLMLLRQAASVPSDYLPYWESIKKKGPRGVISHCPITAACFVTTGHRTGLPPLPIPIITLM